MEGGGIEDIEEIESLRADTSSDSSDGGGMVGGFGESHSCRNRGKT